MQAGGQEFESLHLHSSERMPIGFTGDDSMQKKLCVMMAGKTVRKEWKAIPEEMYLENRIQNLISKSKG